MLRRTVALLLAVFALGLAAPGGGRTAMAENERGLDEFIAVVWGQDPGTVRRTFPRFQGGLFDQVYGPGEGIALNGERDRELFIDQPIRTPGGVLLDVGHVIAGLEAAPPLPLTAMLVQQVTGCELRGAVTWSGDLGEALAAYLVAGGAGEIAPFIAMYADDYDLLGDLDGYVLSAGELTTRDTGALLETAYYADNLDGTRFSRFRGLFGDDFADMVTRETACFARALLLRAGNSAEVANVTGAAGPFAAHFVEWVNLGAAIEASVAAR